MTADNRGPQTPTAYNAFAHKDAADAPTTRPVPALDWREEDDDEYVEVRGIPVRIMKMWVGAEGQPAR